MQTDPTSDAAPATDVADRLRRLEERVSARPATHTDDELANRVIAILAEKAAQQRAAAGSAPPVPGLIPAALVAARTAFAMPPPGVAPPTVETGFRAWILTQVVGEFRLMLHMYFDPRYRLSRLTQFGVPAVLALVAVNYLLFNYSCLIPVAGPIGERLVLVVLAVVLYRLLVKEAGRYKQVLDYLAQYGYG